MALFFSGEWYFFPLHDKFFLVATPDAVIAANEDLVRLDDKSIR